MNHLHKSDLVPAHGHQASAAVQGAASEALHGTAGVTARRAASVSALLLLVLAAMILNGCTAQLGDTDEAGLIPHLKVDLQLPETLISGSTGRFELHVEQRGAAVEADEVIFAFWSEDDPTQRVEVAGVAQGKGIYSAEYPLSGEGLYRVRAHVIAGSLEALPTKRFALGEQAVQRLAALEAPPEAGASGAGGSGGEGGGGGHHH